MSIKQRIENLERISKNNGGVVMWVKIVEDDGSIIDCSHRQDDCPEYPCKADSCWMENKYPDMKVVNVDGDQDDN
jgi:hypothetical protein